MRMNSWEFEREDDRIRVSQRPADRPTLILETPTHHATLEFGTVLELHEFQSAFEHHLVTSGWSLVGFSRRRLVAAND
jgi:hypothetical protein